jgi:hypothetical protein
VEVAVLAALGAVGMVIVLGVELRVVDVALGIVVELVERALVGQALGDDVGFALASTR